jgi:hypothetical protein
VSIEETHSFYRRRSLVIRSLRHHTFVSLVHTLLSLPSSAPHSSDATIPSHEVMNGMNRRQAYTLYSCHLLSAWNARCYEFAAVSILFGVTDCSDADEIRFFSLMPLILEGYVLCPFCMLLLYLLTAP